MRTATRWPIELVLLAIAAGCSSLPPAHEAAEAVLPARFQEWTLFEVDGSVLYAADANEAEQAAALAAEAASDFRARTGREPSRRILLIVDHEAWLPGGDVCRRLQLAIEGDLALHGPRHTTGEGANGGVGEQVPPSCDELLAQSAEMGVEPRDMLCLMAHPLALERLTQDFGLPAEARAAWDGAVILPAEDGVDDAMGRVLDAAMEKELSFAQRLLAAPFMPIARSFALDAVLASQKVLLFELHAAAQADWSPEQRGQLAKDYEDALERGVEDEVEAVAEAAAPSP